MASLLQRGPYKRAFLKVRIPKKARDEIILWKFSVSPGEKRRLPWQRDLLMPAPLSWVYMDRDTLIKCQLFVPPSILLLRIEISFYVLP